MCGREGISISKYNCKSPYQNVLFFKAHLKPIQHPGLTKCKPFFFLWKDCCQNYHIYVWGQCTCSIRCRLVTFWADQPEFSSPTSNQGFIRWIYEPSLKKFWLELLFFNKFWSRIRKSSTTIPGGRMYKTGMWRLIDREGKFNSQHFKKENLHVQHLLSMHGSEPAPPQVPQGSLGFSFWLATHLSNSHCFFTFGSHIISSGMISEIQWLD